MIPARDNDYRNWRASRLDQWPRSADDLRVDIGGLIAMSEKERASIKALVLSTNMAVYACRERAANRAEILAFAARFGLTRLDHHLCANDDGVSELTVASVGKRGEYVPYSSSSLSWHTDGYYNDATKQVRAVVLHCNQDANSGGENAVLDPEIAYIRLRDADPAFIKAFENPKCMTIPANVSEGEEIRPAVSGPVFSFDGLDGSLHMRYSERKRNIKWRDDGVTTAARKYLADLLSNQDSPVLHFYLRPGQGLISNNVLHNRTAFEDTATQSRFLYRARFFERVDTS